MDLEQWSVGGRGFGTIFIFLLMAGEIYSTFTFLGGAVFYGKFKPMGFLTIFSEGGIGAKLVVVGSVTALVTCLIAAVKPDPKTT